MLSRQAVFHKKRMIDLITSLRSRDILLNPRIIPMVIHKIPYGACDKKSSHSVTYKPYVEPCYEDHDHKNMRLKRPMSPHLTIYAPTLTAMTSIAERISGIILSMYATFLSFGALFLSNGIDTYVSMIQSLDMSRPLIFLIKLLAGLPFLYHYFNGIRFIAWTLGKWLAIKDIYGSAQKCFILTGIFTVLFALR